LRPIFATDKGLISLPSGLVTKTLISAKRLAVERHLLAVLRTIE
jgi:hypothetical protein